jgi:hypothetical protein
MGRQPVLACDRGLADSLRADLLGGYDGVGSWSVFVEHVRGADEHLMVQAHEALHHELQTSTVWGCLASVAAMLGQSGIRGHALNEVFDYAIAGSTNVHELYATYLADALGRERHERDVLIDNARYSQFRQRAAMLLRLDAGDVGTVPIAATAAILRCCMAPAGLADLVGDLDFQTLSISQLRSAVNCRPDERLALFESLNTDLTIWQELLRELAEQDPGHQQRILAEHRTTTQEDLRMLTQQWSYEVQVVQRRCFELVAEILAKADEPTLQWSRLDQLTARIARAGIAADPSLQEVLKVGDLVPTDGADLLEFSRQGIALRSRLPLEILADTEVGTLALIDGMVVQKGTEQEHLCALWTEPKMLEKQFEVEAADLDLRVCLFTRARDADGQPVARIGILQTHRTARELQRIVAPTPLLVLTTHSALVHDDIAAALSGVEPVFVLMDLPIGWHIDHWLRQDARVRYGVATVDAEKELALLAVSVDHAAHLRFFHIGGMVALGSLLERLRQRYDPDLVGHDQTVLDQEIAGLTMAANHVLHTFSVLDQDGVS